MSRQAILFLAAGLVLAACSSRPDPAPVERAPVNPEALVPAVNVVPESGLGPQQLAKNECGLFLWSKTDPTQLIFFERAQTGRATVQIGSKAVEVTQTINRGEIFGEFMTEQGFAAPDGEQILLTIVPGEPLQAGQRVEAGKLEISTPEGWRTLIPVLGVRACQP
ncbi:hypothetical protein [Henriciella sp.]|uniref:hypothetical protein n=1 Tax=Henriciella sp. TaxID=1968823 RepID=UPI0026036F39|nr:hypothetical protein [Henriciella sp.]